MGPGQDRSLPRRDSHSKEPLVRTLLLLLTLLVGTLHPNVAHASDNPGFTAGTVAIQPNYAVHSTVAAFSCYVAAPSAVGVAISSCRYGGTELVGAPGIAAPGPFVATAGTAVNPNLDRQVVCYAGTVTFAVGQVVPFSGCSLITSE